MQNPAFRQVLDRFLRLLGRWNTAWLSGIFALFLGITVVSGWLTGNELLTRFRLEYVSMMFNSALCLILCGLGLLGHSDRSRTFTRACSALIAVICAITLAEYFLPFDLDFDNLIFNHPVDNLASIRGRMAPNSAVTFLLAALALYLLDGPNKRAWIVGISGSLGAAIFGLASIPFLGYILNTQDNFSGWGEFTRMALPTSIGLMVLGVGILSLTWNKRKRNAPWPAWLPFASALGVAVGILSIALALITSEHKTISYALDRETNSMELKTLDVLDEYTQKMNNMGEIWSKYSRVSQTDLDFEMEIAAQDFPGFEACAWLDTNLNIKWLAPLEKNEAVGNQNPDIAELRRELWERARTQRQTIISRPLKMLDSSLGFYLFTPIYHTEALQGIFLGMIRYSRFFENLDRSRSMRGLTFTMLDSSERIFVSTNISKRADNKWKKSVAILLPGTSWTLNLWPTKTQLLKWTSPTASIILAFGLIVALMLGLSLFLTVKSQGLTLHLKETHLKLEEEHRQLEQSASILEQRVEERTTELKFANKELEAFSYSVSHDLRAPLRHIGGFTELLQAKSEAMDPGSKRYLVIISEAVKRMDTLITSLLGFARMSRQEMQKSRFSMAEMVSQSIQEMEPDLKGRKITWKVAPLPEAFGDQPLLRQVVANLFTNAVKFTREREEAIIEVQCHEENSGHVYCIRDNGAGFDMKYAEKLFGVFQRLHSASQFEGTGIGLANVQRIIVRHGGRVWAEGEVGKGAAFFFFIPIQA